MGILPFMLSGCSPARAWDNIGCRIHDRMARTGMIKTIAADDLAALVSRARESERQRAHLNVHDSLDAPVQRLFIAMEPETYIPPHRHSPANKWEFLVLIDGTLDLLIFANDGTLSQRTTLAPDHVRAVELPPGTWHGYVVRESGTVVLEVKEGPFTPTPEHDLAPWAPAEKDPRARAGWQWMRDARPGERFPSVINGAD